MSFLIGFMIVLVLLYIIGRLIYSQQQDKQIAFVKIFIVFFKIMLGNFLIMIPVFALLLLVIALGDQSSAELVGKLDTGGLLMGTLIIILITAILHFLYRRRFVAAKKGYALSEEDYEICEYFIQWMTIYIVVYQFLFDGLLELSKLLLTQTQSSHMFAVWLSPSNMNFVIQPLLIATWIVVVMEKYVVRHQNQS